MPEPSITVLCADSTPPLPCAIAVSQPAKSQASPSGVYVLSFNDSVVEFHNSLLDHFFITATADEQAAIRGGAAGPGCPRQATCSARAPQRRSAGSYGSTSPGPNSHFFTIDPAECQRQKKGWIGEGVVMCAPL